MAEKKYSVILEKVGNQPLMTTKILREELGLGLASAKAMVDKVPTTIASDVDGAVALDLKEQLEAVGNTVFVPRLEIKYEPAATTTTDTANNTTISVDEAFDAIFGGGAAQKAAPLITSNGTKKRDLKETVPMIAEKKNIAAVNGAFDALFGNQEKGTEK